MRASAMVFALAAATVGSLAHSATIEPFTCRNGLFPSEQDELHLARAVGDKNAKLRFYTDFEGCPDGGDDKCATKAYVLPGDELIVNKVRGEWACVWFSGKKHETVGWVHRAGLELLPEDESGDQARWTGKWQAYPGSGSIDIASAGKGLRVGGKAYWYGATLPDGSQSVHFGEIEGTMTPQGNKAALSMGDGPYDCKAQFSLEGKYLIVTDNSDCGGVNVRFDGVYTRAAGAKKTAK